MIITRSFTAIALVLAAMGSSVPAAAHGLLMKLEALGDTINGQVYFTNGEEAGGVWVEMFDEGAPDIALETIQVGSDGRFALEGEQGRAYQFRATGDEGHAITMAITLEGEAARGAMVEDSGEIAEAPEDEAAQIPAWAFLGGFLLLSLIPAMWLRKRKKSA